MESYHELLRDVLVNGNFKMTRAVDPASGQRLGAVSVFGRTWTHDLHENEGFPLLTTKKVFWKGIVEELLWFIRGETNVKSLQEKGVHIWDAWSYDPEQKWGGRTHKLTPDEHPGDVGPVYGYGWRQWPAPKRIDKAEIYNTAREINESALGTDDIYGYIESLTSGSFTQPIDQIKRVERTLVENPDDRRMVVSAWNPADIDKMGLPPCHYAFQFTSHLEHVPGCAMATPHPTHFPNQPTIRWKGWHGARVCTCATHSGRGPWPKRRLNCLVHMRSADIFLGVPFNIASYALLLRMMAWVTNHVPGRLTFTFGDLHLYENHFAQAEELLTRKPRPLPVVKLRARIGSIDEFTADDIRLEGYDPHPAIKAPVGV